MKKREAKEVKTVEYGGTAEAKRVFSEEVEKKLADHIKKLAEKFHGLTPKKCRELALELAERNYIPTHSNWREKGLAGKDWFKNFMARYRLSLAVCLKRHLWEGLQPSIKLQLGSSLTIWLT
uniref:HTH CENPB-type domain-containing protein n=1 Tax=Sparus aurata TaxID=8175 RepID=A0A671X1I5_SPAAU